MENLTNPDTLVAGSTVLVMILIEVLKRAGLVPDDQAGRWTAVGNVALYVLYVVLGIFNVDLSGDVPASIVEILTQVGRLALMILGAPFLYGILRSAKIVKPMPGRGP